jgi:hypothetical protein
MQRSIGGCNKTVRGRLPDHHGAPPNLPRVAISGISGAASPKRKLWCPVMGHVPDLPPSEREFGELKRRYVVAFFQKLPPCLVGIEACASSHHWSRELQTLGHAVRLMPPAYVRPYVKRHKNDAR